MNFEEEYIKTFKLASQISVLKTLQSKCGQDIATFVSSTIALGAIRKSQWTQLNSSNIYIITDWINLLIKLRDQKSFECGFQLFPQKKILCSDIPAEWVKKSFSINLLQKLRPGIINILKQIKSLLDSYYKLCADYNNSNGVDNKSLGRFTQNMNDISVFFKNIFTEDKGTDNTKLYYAGCFLGGLVAGFIVMTFMKS